MFRSPPVPRAEGITDRQVNLSLSARFYDELLSGLPDVLMPTIRVHLGLSFIQISLLQMALDYVAATVEPVSGLLIDLWPRRWLMAWGAAGIGISIILVGVAPTFLALAIAFGLYGLGSGPLAHTADVVLVEAHPAAPDRIFARATLLDTIGALLGPALVTATFWLHLPWRWLVVGLGMSSLVYAALILRTHFPPAAAAPDHQGQGFLSTVRRNVQTVFTHPTARYWLLFSLAFELLETPFRFKTVWLAEYVGMSQALVGVYRIVEMAVGLVSLLALDRWRLRAPTRQVLKWVAISVAFLYPVWLFIPGIWPRFLLAIPLMFLFSMFWPVVRAQSLVSIPGHAGAMTAVLSLIGFLPLSLLFGLLADQTTLTFAMFVAFGIGISGMFLIMTGMKAT